MINVADRKAQRGIQIPAEPYLWIYLAAPTKAVGGGSAMTKVDDLFMFQPMRVINLASRRRFS